MTYTKTINGRQVFSDCRTIQLEYDHPQYGLVAGQYVSNPSQELVLEDGWEVYVPPVIPPSPSTEPDTYEVMEAVKKMLAPSIEELSDEDALAIAALYPTWVSKMGESVNVGERYWYDGRLWKVVQAHTVQEDWTPDVSTSLFTEVSIEEWPEWVQPTGSSDAYMTGDKVTFEGRHYICTVDYNVYAPNVYGWEEA